MPAESPPRIAAIVLAAGSSRRYGRGNKLLAPIDGMPMIRRVCAAACASSARPVIVVTGHDPLRVRRALQPLRARLRPVFNRRYRDGMASSLQRGAAALPADCAGAVICLGDMPAVDARQINALLRAFRPGDTAVVPVAGGRRGNPVLLGRALLERLDELSGDEGARRLLSEASGVRRVPASRVVLRDIDRRHDRACFRGCAF